MQYFPLTVLLESSGLSKALLFEGFPENMESVFHEDLMHPIYSMKKVGKYNIIHDENIFNAHTTKLPGISVTRRSNFFAYLYL